MSHLSSTRDIQAGLASVLLHLVAAGDCSAKYSEALSFPLIKYHTLDARVSEHKQCMAVSFTSQIIFASHGDPGFTAILSCLGVGCEPTLSIILCLILLSSGVGGSLNPFVGGLPIFWQEVDIAFMIICQLPIDRDAKVQIFWQLSFSSKHRHVR